MNLLKRGKNFVKDSSSALQPSFRLPSNQVWKFVSAVDVRYTRAGTKRRLTEKKQFSAVSIVQTRTSKSKWRVNKLRRKIYITAL